MSQTTEVIIAQTRLMELDLTLVLQQMKVNELKAREDTLKARGQVERFKLAQMKEIHKTLKE